MTATNIWNAFRVALAAMKPEELAHISAMPEQPTLADAEAVLADFAMAVARKVEDER